MKYLALLLALMVAGCVAGCAGHDGVLTSTEPICDALLKPIKTNTQKTTSKRYLPPSSTDLRADIKQHNQVGLGLHCPTYIK